MTILQAIKKCSLIVALLVVFTGDGRTQEQPKIRASYKEAWQSIIIVGSFGEQRSCNALIQVTLDSTVVITNRKKKRTQIYTLWKIIEVKTIQAEDGPVHMTHWLTNDGTIIGLGYVDDRWLTRLIIQQGEDAVVFKINISRYL